MGYIWFFFIIIVIMVLLQSLTEVEESDQNLTSTWDKSDSSMRHKNFRTFKPSSAGKSYVSPAVTAARNRLKLQYQDSKETLRRFSSDELSACIDEFDKNFSYRYHDGFYGVGILVVQLLMATKNKFVSLSEVKRLRSEGDLVEILRILSEMPAAPPKRLEVYKKRVIQKLAEMEREVEESEIDEIIEKDFPTETVRAQIAPQLGEERLQALLLKSDRIFDLSLRRDFQNLIQKSQLAFSENSLSRQKKVFWNPFLDTLSLILDAVLKHQNEESFDMRHFQKNIDLMEDHLRQVLQAEENSVLSELELEMKVLENNIRIDYPKD